MPTPRTAAIYNPKRGSRLPRVPRAVAIQAAAETVRTAQDAFTLDSAIQAWLTAVDASDDGMKRLASLMESSWGILPRLDPTTRRRVVPAAESIGTYIHANAYRPPYTEWDSILPNVFKASLSAAALTRYSGPFNRLPFHLKEAPRICTPVLIGTSNPWDEIAQLTAAGKLQVHSSPAGPDFDPSVDYRSVRWKGHDFRFTRLQAAVVKELHTASQAGHPEVDQQTLLASVESDAQRLLDIFRVTRKRPPGKKFHPAWRSLIVSNRGMYRLAL